MDRAEAARLLGVDAAADHGEVRAAYRRLLLRTHPDVSGDADATDRTVLLTQAFTVLTTTAPDPGGFAPDRPPVDRERAPVAVVLVDDDTIGVAAPPDETLLLVLDAAHHLGDISYLDPSAGLVEVIVEFVEAPTSSVLLTLQGRATGITDVFCSVEPLSGGEAPPADAVTRLVLATLADLHPAPDAPPDPVRHDPEGGA